MSTEKFTKSSATKRFGGGMEVTLHGEAVGDYLVHSAKQISGEKGYMVTRISTGETISGTRAVDRDLAKRMAREQASGSKNPGGMYMRKNPYGYIIAGRTRPHAYSATRDFPYKDRSEAKRVIGERVRAMGRRGDDVAFDAFLTKPRGRKIGKTRIRVPGYARNPEVWLDWQQRGHTMRDPTGRSLHTGRALWRKGLSKRGTKREAAAARKYARRQKDWTKYGVTVKRNPIYHYKHRYDSKQPWKRDEVKAEDYDFATQLMMKRHPDEMIDLDEVQHTDVSGVRVIGPESRYKVQRKVWRPSRKRLLRPRARNPLQSFNVWMSGSNETRTVKAHTAYEAAAKAAGGPVMRDVRDIRPGGRSTGPMYFKSKYQRGRENAIKVWPKSKSGNPMRRKRRNQKRGVTKRRKMSRLVKRRPRNAKGQFIKVKRKRAKRR